MKSTIDLLEMAKQAAPSERQLALELGLSATTLAKARRANRLSPLITAKLAERMRQPVAEWMALANIEAEPRVKAPRSVEALAAKVRNSYFARLVKRAAMTGHRPQKPHRSA